MRRATLLLAVGAALAVALPAAAALQPVQRGSLPRVRAGSLPLPARGPARVRVIADLAAPPLAAWRGRTLAQADGRRKLDVAAASSRAYLARLAAAQARAVADLRRAIPEARVGRRFRILLDGLTVELPAARLPALVRRPWVAKVYPSLRYTLLLDRSPSVIGADALRAQLGADGTGIKIGVVDDGIDETNPFFAPQGFSYPPGFPKGGAKWVTPKVIVAKVFPGPNAGRPGRLAVDPRSSFHGTHVAGIAAGDSGTTAPAGSDHPQVTGLSGVAPRAWLGNYRVFTVPTPIGHVANTPEIVAAFEAAVQDGMDVINFSGGGPQTDPANDAMVETIHNVVQAGVVPVIAMGNDRDEFGMGSAGSPGTAPDAIGVAAVSNTHVFSPALDVVAPGGPTGIPFQGAGGTLAPPAWGTTDQTLVDVATIVGTDGKAVDPHLCGPPGNLASTQGTLPRGSLSGTIALAQRGLCPFVTKAEQARAAGAIGIVLADNREGEANPIPIRLAIAAGMVSNLDGQRLRAFLATRGGRAAIRVGRDPLELETGRSGVVTSFSSAGPTPFGHDLKPDVAAPGGQILSSTLPATNESRFAVFDGTSMATPHVAGAAALLLQLHRSWTPEEVKSALVATAGPAWADTARTQEAPVTLEGGGLVALTAAADPRLFTDPVSLSFGDVAPGATRALLVRVTDAGDGAGTWSVALQPQATAPGSTITAQGTVDVAPGGDAEVPVVARAGADAQQGESYGFVVLRRGDVVRRVPYLFLVDRPALASAPALRLKPIQRGDTRTGENRVDRYGYPAAPFGNAPDQPPMEEDGAETVYTTTLTVPAANIGVSVISSSRGARIDPFYLGAKDETQVQGFAGTPVNVNALMYDYLVDYGAAGASFPRQTQFYVSVDSGRQPFTDRRQPGSYVLRAWVNDVTPPRARLLTTRVAAGRPTLVLETTDSQSGVDPLALTLDTGSALVGATAYDPFSGIAVFPLPASVRAFRAGTYRIRFQSSDYEEGKNVNTTGTSIMPNTRFGSAQLHVVRGTAVDWILPPRDVCVGRTERLVVAAGAPSGIRFVRFLDGGRRIATVRRGSDGLYGADWRTRRAHAGRHSLEAVAVAKDGRTSSVRRTVLVCR